MRIAFLSSEFVRSGQPDGGLANYLAKVCPLLREQGHDISVFVPGSGSGPVPRMPFELVEVPGFWAPTWMFRGFLYPYKEVCAQWVEARRLATSLARAHTAKPYDIVQAASWRAVGRAVVGKGIAPVVVRISSWTPAYRAAHGRRTHLTDRITDRFEQDQIRKADAVFAPSHLHADLVSSQVRRHVGVIRTPFVIPDCSEDEALYQAELRSRKYLLYFGKLNGVKGADVFAEALRQILPNRSDLHVAFLGDDGDRPDLPGTYGELVEAVCSAFRDRVHMLGCQPRETVLPVLRNAHLVVLPSRVDNYPNTCLEAQTLGKIVVGTRGTSLDEMICDGESGFLCQPASPDDLANALQRALALSPHARSTMEANVRGLARERDPQHDVDELIALYQRTIAESPLTP